jgi:VanZ family protein
VRFIPAIVASAALILAGPIVGQLRAAVQSAFPERYEDILVVTAGTCIALGLAAGLTRIRERRAVRYALLLAALVIGVTYSVLSRTGDRSVDAIERFHFVEYGLITLLFSYAWREEPGASRLVLPVLAGVLVGTLEEWLQWFVPARIGEARDILLNLWAILCGLLFSVALDPPERVDLSLHGESRRRVQRMAAVALFAFALFFHSAHLGYEIADPTGGRFRSLYTRDRLFELARARADEWRTNPPTTWSRYSREDQYFSEGIALVRRRNECFDARDGTCAWRANVLLEQYYAPVLDAPSYVSAAGHRWTSEQRADVERQAKGHDPNAALVDESIIVTWPKSTFWMVVALAMAALLWL